MTTIAERMGVTKSERRRLWDYECALCGQRLAREGCGAIYAPRCTPQQMHERRQKVLAELRSKRKRRGGAACTMDALVRRAPGEGGGA